MVLSMTHDAGILQYALCHKPSGMATWLGNSGPPDHTLAPTHLFGRANLINQQHKQNIIATSGAVSIPTSMTMHPPLPVSPLSTRAEFLFGSVMLLFGHDMFLFENNIFCFEMTCFLWE